MTFCEVFLVQKLYEAASESKINVTPKIKAKQNGQKRFRMRNKIYFFCCRQTPWGFSSHSYYTWVSTVLCHRRSLSATASGIEGLLLLMTLGSLITEPRDPLTRWIRDLRRQDRAWGETDIAVRVIWITWSHNSAFVVVQFIQSETKYWNSQLNVHTVTLKLWVWWS